ncbi:hypothetical protein FKM82_000062 [Ascaphus truei]
MTVKLIAATMCLLLGLNVSASTPKPKDDPGVSTHKQINQILLNYNKFLESVTEIFSGIPHIGSTLYRSMYPGSVRSAASNGPSQKSDSCDCDYHHSGGCTISQLPSPGKFGLSLYTTKEPGPAEEIKRAHNLTLQNARTQKNR